MDAGVVACHLGRLQILPSQFLRPAKRLAIWHYFSEHSLLVCDSCCQRLWTQQNWPAVCMKLGDQHAFGISRQFEAGVCIQVNISKCLRDILL